MSNNPGQHVACWVSSDGGATWTPYTGGGAGGGAVTIADSADVAQGSKADIAWVAGDGTVISLLKKIASAGGSAVSIADGADVAQGALADAANTTGIVGTISGKLRGLVAILADVWDSVTHALRVEGTVAVSNLPATQPVSAAALPLPAGAATEATLVLVKAKTDNLDVLLSTRTKPADSQLVGAPVGTPVFVRLSDGAAALVGQKTMALSLPFVLASDQTAFPVNGDVDHDAVNTLKNIQIAGNASPADVPPTLVSANGDRTRVWTDRAGTVIVRRRKIRESYTAVFRLAEAAARLDQTFTQVANTNKQWATLHHTAGATKEVWLQRWTCYITGWTVASQAILELRQLSAAPATGNPAITPTPRRQGATAVEAVCLYLPTTAGTELAVNSPIASRIYDLGVMGAISAANPVSEIEIVLYDATRDGAEMLPPVLPAATLSGLACMLRTVGVPAVRMTCVATFTEEVP